MLNGRTVAGTLPMGRQVRPVLLVLASLLILSAASWLAQRTFHGQPSHPATSAGWTLVFDEPFDGTELESSRWTTCYWWDKGGCTNMAIRNCNGIGAATSRSKTALRFLEAARSRSRPVRAISTIPRG
jgi:hypothetical protein